MPKAKARKSVMKRFRITAGKKVMRRRSNQNHFNARSTTDQKRAKRTDQVVSKKASENLKADMLSS